MTTIEEILRVLDELAIIDKIHTKDGHYYEINARGRQLLQLIEDSKKCPIKVCEHDLIDSMLPTKSISEGEYIKYFVKCPDCGEEVFIGYEGWLAPGRAEK